MVADHHAEVGQFLQHAYFVAVAVSVTTGRFQTLSGPPVLEADGAEEAAGPVDLEVGPLLIMQATTTDMGHRADKYAVILDGLKQEQVEVGAVAARIQELGGIGAAYEALRVRKRGDAQVSGTVAVAETAAAGRRTRRHDERSPRQIGESVMPTKRPRRRRPQPVLPHPSLPNLFAGKEDRATRPIDRATNC